MAIIDKDTRMTVATRLANLNYKEQMDSSLAKLNELFEKYIIGKTPDDVLKCCFNDKPCPLVQVTENLDCYKQVDGAIYEISNGSPVE